MLGLGVGLSLVRQQLSVWVGCIQRTLYVVLPQQSSHQKRSRRNLRCDLKPSVRPSPGELPLAPKIVQNLWHCAPQSAHLQRYKRKGFGTRLVALKKTRVGCSCCVHLLLSSMLRLDIGIVMRALNGKKLKKSPEVICM